MPTPVIVTGSGSSAHAGFSLTTYRQRLAETLGYFATGTISTLAASIDAGRALISDDLTSDQAAPESVNGLYVWIRNGTQALTPRRVVDGTLDGPIGALLVDRAYSAPLQTGTFFEIAVLPGDKYMGA